MDDCKDRAPACLLRQALVGAVGAHGFDVEQPLDRAANGLEIGEHPAEPTLRDVEHPAALGLLNQRLLGLPLGADEQHLPTLADRAIDRLLRRRQRMHRLLEIDDVDPIALHEDVALHLGVPTPGLVPEVDPRLQQLSQPDLHRLLRFGLDVRRPGRIKSGNRKLGGV